MTNVLVVTTSLNGDNGQSNKLVSQFVSQWQQSADLSISVRDLVADELPHLGAAEMQAWMTAESERSDEQNSLAAISDNYIEELQAADVVVLGMPMYNFGAPSVFKAWIDRVARAGRTFKYTETGPVGLLTNKKVYVLATRGGMYAGTAKDTQTAYITDIFNFLGIQDVEFIYAEGLAMGEESAAQALQHADQKIVELIAKHAA